MPDPLIITLSCARDRLAAQDAIRFTWRRMLPKGLEHVFLLGRGNNDPAGDEWVVDAPDDYPGHQEKYRGALVRALDRGYDFVFLACIDTYIEPGRLLASGFLRHDYTGRKCDGEPHASGGCGYWLSRHAMLWLVTEPVTTDYADRADFQCLRRNEIALHDDQRYGTSITKHLSRGTGVYDPAWMIETHQKYLETPLE